MSDGEDYVRIRGRVMEVRPKAVLFAIGRSVPRGDWVPRSCIHGADDRMLDSKLWRSGEETTLRIFKWKAEQISFTGEHIDEAAEEDLLDRIEKDMGR